MTDVAKADWRYLTEQVRKLEAERDDFKALAQRVHAECGPELCAGRYGCPCTLITAPTIKEIPHELDCLWLAADELLKKVREI